MSTFADLVADVRERLSSSLTDELNTLAVPYTAGSDQVSLTYDARNLAPGMLLSCGTNTWYVLAWNNATKTATVIPGIDASTSIAQSTGAIVRVAPRFTDWAIFKALRDQLASMGTSENGLGIISFWVDLADYDSNLYEPPVGVVPQRIRAAYGKSGAQWYPLRRYSWEIGAVHVYDEGSYNELMFVYQDNFNLPSLLTEDPVADAGLSDTMLDIPVLGAAALLLMSKESQRNQINAQGDTRRAAEVMAGANIGTAREWLRLRDQRIADEYSRAVNAVSLVGG